MRTTQATPMSDGGVLPSKLRVPLPAAGLVHRPRLLDLLDAGAAGALTLVSAPAGSGKTAMLSDWVASRRPGAAWVSLDADDNDPVRFWRHVLTAFEEQVPGLADKVGALLGQLTHKSLDGAGTPILQALGGTGAATLVLDDYHLIEAEPVHASLLFLLEHASPRLHVTLAGRADPPIPVARLRANRQLTEIRTDALAFTPQEAGALLQEAAGTGVRSDIVALLTTRTEGWAAGLQLAGLSVRGHTDPEELLTGFTGSHRHVLDYLTEEVLDAQPEQIREFLLATSVLDSLCGPLCDAVTGGTNGQRMLEEIEQANLFLVPLDEVRGWWRYHHVFAQLIRARVGEAEHRVQQHEAAARWFAANGMEEDAIRHAVAAGDPDLAGRLIENRFDARFRAGEQATVTRWLAMLPAETVTSSPRLCLAEAFAALFTNDLDLVDARLATVADLAEPEDEFSPSVDVAQSLIADIPTAVVLVGSMAARARGDLAVTHGLAREAVDRSRRASPAQARASRQQLAIAEWLAGRLDEAEPALAATMAGWRADDLMMVTWGTNALGPMQLAQGRLGAARATYQALLTRASEPGRTARAGAEGVAHLGLAEVAYERGDLDDAQRHVTEAIARGRALDYRRLLSSGLTRLAWIAYARGDVAGARDAVEEATRAIPTHGPTELTPAPVQRARLLLALGEVHEVERWLAQEGLALDGELDHLRESGYLVLARLLLERQRPERALALLERLLSIATMQHRSGSVIEILAVRARALHARGERDRALEALTDGLLLARPEGQLRVFVDEGPPMAALVGALVKAGVPPAVQQVLDRVAAELRRSPGGPAEVRGDMVLSPREIELVQLLAQGRTNKQIAAELYLSLSTVKHHVTHILTKLGAANRTEAVARARTLGLVQPDP